MPVRPQGTEFQEAAWKALSKIPYGVTRSYGDQARAIGNPKAVRAIGAANGRNPIPIIIPCHRVIGADGSLTGFGGGMKTKQFLAGVGAGPAAASLRITHLATVFAGRLRRNAPAKSRPGQIHGVEHDADATRRGSLHCNFGDAWLQRRADPVDLDNRPIQTASSPRPRPTIAAASPR